MKLANQFKKATLVQKIEDRAMARAEAMEEQAMATAAAAPQPAAASRDDGAGYARRRPDVAALKRSPDPTPKAGPSRENPRPALCGAYS